MAVNKTDPYKRVAFRGVTLDANYASLAAITATGKNLDQLKFG